MRVKAFNFWLLLFLVVLILAAGAKDFQMKSFPKEKIFEIPAKLAAAAPVNISNTSTGSESPIVCTDSSGKAYVVWTEIERSRGIYFTTNKSGKWATSRRVHSCRSTSEEAGFPSFSAAPNGVCHLSFHDVPGDSYDIIHYEYENDWSNPFNVSESAGGSAYSSIKFSPADNYLYTVWMDGTFFEWDLMFRYRDPSKRWGSIETLSFYGGKYLPDLAVDGKGTAHLVWITRGGSNSTVWYSKNPNPRDNHQWTEEIVVAGGTGVEWSWPKIACDNAGNAYVVWIGNREGKWDIFCRRKVNEQWQGTENISKTGGTSDLPAVAADKNSGIACVAWSESVGGNWEIFFAAYQPGVGWSSPTNMTNNSSRSITPSVCIDNYGNIHLAYADNAKGNFEIMYSTTGATYIQIYPPINISIESKYDASRNRKTNTLRWERNPSNEDITLTNYRIYRKEAQQGNESYVVIASVPETTFSYTDANLAPAQIYTYVLTSVAEGGQESSDSEAVSDQKVYPPTYPPIRLSLESRTGDSQTEKINILTWQKNPKNEGLPIVNYQIYRREEQQESTVKLASVSANTFRYVDRRLPTTKKYIYVLTSIPEWGIESGDSEPAVEERVFPPISVGIKTVIHSGLFFKEKVNIVNWNANPLNDAVVVTKYSLFRKKSGQSDSDYQWMSSILAGNFEFVDRSLLLNEKFSYALTAIDKDGNESKKSTSADEK